MYWPRNQPIKWTKCHYKHFSYFIIFSCEIIYVPKGDFINEWRFYELIKNGLESTP